jgi:DNA-binding SARP family transcriptional activator
VEQDDSTVNADLAGRSLAILAVTAHGGPGGVSREQVLGILWPEVDEERGRHNLSQLLYNLKRQLTDEVIVAGVKSGTLRINTSLLTSDLEDFRTAVTARDWASAARCYTGPFLSGFYLEEAPEFERWVEDARGTLRHDGERALEARAEATQRAGEAAESRDCWRRLTELDPLNSRFAYGYVLALAMSGDRGGAVRYGTAHAAKLKEELGSAPPSRLTDLLTRLQRGTFVSTQAEPQQRGSGGGGGGGGS